MRHAVVAFGVVLAVGCGEAPSSLAPAPAEPSAQRFEPAAFLQRPAGSPELAARFAWPELAAFHATHAGHRGAEPIRLVRGRALRWNEPETAHATAPAQTFPALVARGAAIVEVTTQRQEDFERAYSDLMDQNVFNEAAYAPLERERERRGEREGDGRELADALWGLRRGDGRDAIVFAGSPGADDPDLLDGLPASVIADWRRTLDQPFAHTSGSTRFVFVPQSASPVMPIDARAWEDWTYATTLLALDRPLYEPLARDRHADVEAAFAAAKVPLERVRSAMNESAAAGLGAVRAALAEGGPLDDWGWQEVAEFAQQQGAIDLALAVRARHRPMGGCSMDMRPQEAARRYAELCFAAGKLSCFLNLQIQIMGDQFPRVAYSSYGEAAHPTEVRRLRDIGIDEEKFLRGLLYQFDLPGVDRREIGLWRLARSIDEAGHAARMGALLRAEVARPDLDDFNRLRAAATLLYLSVQTASPHDIHAELASIGLPEPAASWVRWSRD